MVQATTTILVVGSVASFLLAFGIGANDVGGVSCHSNTTACCALAICHVRRLQTLLGLQWGARR